MEKKQNQGSILTTERLEAFSDGVFAIVITLLFINLKPPSITISDDWAELLEELYALAPKFLSIVISFTFVAIFWVAHHQFFHTLRETTRGLLWLNLVFLFLVCFVPFPAAIMAEFPNNKTSVVFFGATVLLTSLLLVALRYYAWLKHREISEVADDDDVKKVLRRGYLMVLFYAVALVVSFFHPLTAIALYLLTPLTLLFPVKVGVETENESGERETHEIVV